MDHHADMAGPWPAPRPVPAAMPLWRLYLVCVATFGLYLPFWIHRTARQFGLGQSRRSTPVWWALGSLAVPVAACVLFEFNRRARPRAAGRLGAAGPALLYLVLVPAWSLTPLYGAIVGFPLIAALPFVLVQRNINRAGQARPEAPGPRQRLALAHAAALVLGLPVAAAVLWWYDLPQLRAATTGRLDAGEAVSGRSELYRLTADSDRWRHVAPGTVGDADSDLELLGPGSGTWIVAYAMSSDGTTLETAVSARRSLIFSEGTPASFEETRNFLSGADLVPMSIARYLVGYGLVGTQEYVVLTVAVEDRVVEVVGSTDEPRLYRDELVALVMSFALRTAEEPS